MAKIDGAYQYYLSNYGKQLSSKYDTHKKSELRNVYNAIVKANKESPLYKITQSGDVTKFAIDVKETARQIQNNVAALSINGGSMESMLHHKAAFSSDDAVDVEYVGEEDSPETSDDSFELQVNQLAKPQINTGNFLASRQHDFEAGSYSFDLDTTSNSYEFQFNVNAGDNNLDVQNKVTRLINQANVGLQADLLEGENGTKALSITSKKTGLAENEEYLFHLQSGTSWNEVKMLGIDQVTQPASNSQFVLNGKQRSSLSNTFTINKEFEITMKDITPEGKPAQIGFMTNTDTITSRVNQLLTSYNNMLQLGEKYASTNGNRRLRNEISSIASGMASQLSNAGIRQDDQGQLSINKEDFNNAILGDSSQEAFATLNQFKDTLMQKANRIAINPMNYADKIIVEYKNPSRTFSSPYSTSVYSGMLLDQAL